METALHVLGAFIILDLLAAFALAILVVIIYRRRSQRERSPFAPLIGVFIFLGISSAFIYGGIWMCLRVM
jgi:hypothetical protein